MRMTTGAVVLAGVLFGAAALLPAVSEGRGGNRGQCGQSQCLQNSQNCAQDRQRLRDGSCGNASCPQNTQGTGSGAAKGKGPGDGTGNQGTGPQDGTGYGAPSQQ